MRSSAKPNPRSEPAVASVAKPSTAAVSQRARELWLARGQPVGCDVDIWCEAERQLQAELRAGTPPLGERGIRVDADEAGLSARVERALDRASPPNRPPSPTSLP